ncbi:type II toxin-antitoxin system PemK/MazF family toxin [Brevibacillus sp. NRS-1366]|uniref:type II toxin-antitoxin system PemK/MazF family toxin n=1 Tax=Brevibacillus sp. NRS-1366 TaxID=3233899 RepID=UPI003D1B6751
MDIDKKVNSLLSSIYKFQKLDFVDKDKYIQKTKEWLVSIVDRNYKIKTRPNNEKKSRGRQNVYCLDFGVNIGSEFNYFHFCVVVKEFDRTAIVVPLSTEKENDADWKSAGNLVIPIGEIEDMPYDKKPCYAMVNQIKSISKQRLTDYYDKKQSKHIKMTLNQNQMKLIFDAITTIGEQEVKSKSPEKEKVDNLSASVL